MNSSNHMSLFAQLEDGTSRVATSDEIIAAAREHISRRVRRGTTLSSPRATRDFLTLKLGTLDHEVFAIIFLDRRNRVISYQEMFRGTIDGASVHPREVVKEAVALVRARALQQKVECVVDGAAQPIEGFLDRDQLRSIHVERHSAQCVDRSRTLAILTLEIAGLNDR